MNQTYEVIFFCKSRRLAHDHLLDSEKAVALLWESRRTRMGSS